MQGLSVVYLILTYLITDYDPANHQFWLYTVKIIIILCKSNDYQPLFMNHKLWRSFRKKIELSDKIVIVIEFDCKSSLITLKAFRAIILLKSTRKILKSGSSLPQRQVAWILLTKFALTRPKPAVQKRANLDRTAKSVQLVWIAKYAQERVIHWQIPHFELKMT